MDTFAAQSTGTATRQTETDTQTTMRVRKRNGTFEPVDINKIVRAISRCCYNLPSVDTLRIATKTISGLYDGATTKELDKLSIQTASGDRRAVVVRGIYDPPEIEQMLGAITIGQQAFDKVFPQPKNRFTFLDAGPAANPALTAAAAGFSDAAVHTGAAFANDYTEGFASFLNFLYVLLAFSVVVSLFGMVNTLVLTVFERTRELGMLRTIGMTRRQARRMIRHESVITALIGAALGLPLGIFLALLVTQALSQYDIAISIPIPELVAFTVVAILAGLGAAVIPARRASRLNVLDALHYE